MKETIKMGAISSHFQTKIDGQEVSISAAAYNRAIAAVGGGEMSTDDAAEYLIERMWDWETGDEYTDLGALADWIGRQAEVA